MEQLAFFEIPNPCVGVCQADDRGYCKGCLRNREERFNWQAFNDMQKQEVLRLCHQRRRRRLWEQKRAAALPHLSSQQALDSEALNPQFDFDTPALLGRGSD